MPETNEAAVDARAQETALSKFDQAIDKWFVESFHNSAVSQVTQIYNLVFAAKEDLKQRLAKLA